MNILSLLLSYLILVKRQIVGINYIVSQHDTKEILMLSNALFISSALICAMALSGCSTKIRSYPIEKNTARHGGIPFFLPKPILQIREPIEFARSETLHAIIDVGGLEQFSIELKAGSLNQSIDNVRKALGGGDIKIESKEKAPFYITEELQKEKSVTGEHSSTELERNKKYAAQTVIDSTTETKPIYKPADVEKALSIVWVPDTAREYELVITPSAFASSELSIKLTDGWRFDSVLANTGENQLIKEFGDTLRTVIGAQKEVKVAEISREQAIKLKEMELASKTEEGQKTFSFTKDKTSIPVRIIGFAKRTHVVVIKPGLYELKFENGFVSIPKEDTVLWSKITL